MENENIKCLYYIKDIRTDKVIYIGQTSDFYKRKKSHFYNKITAIDKYMFENGRENFSMNIFSNIDCINMSDNERKIKEDELIVYYDTINSGLNKRRSGLISLNKLEYCNEKRRQRKIIEPDYKNKLNEYSKKSKIKNKEKNKEHIREYRKKYYEEHREEMKKYLKEQYQKHKEKRQKYNQEHREERNKWKREYYRKKKKEQSLINTKTDD